MAASSKTAIFVLISLLLMFATAGFSIYAAYQGQTVPATISLSISIVSLFVTLINVSKYQNQKTYESQAARMTAAIGRKF